MADIPDEILAKILNTNPARDHDHLSGEDIVEAAANAEIVRDLSVINSICNALSLGTVNEVMIRHGALESLHNMLHRYVELVEKYEPETRLGRLLRETKP